jgi:hypothetical protein
VQDNDAQRAERDDASHTPVRCQSGKELEREILLSVSLLIVFARAWSWPRGGDPSGSINIRTETDAVVLIFRSRRLARAV